MSTVRFRFRRQERAPGEYPRLVTKLEGEATQAMRRKAFANVSGDKQTAYTRSAGVYPLCWFANIATCPPLHSHWGACVKSPPSFCPTGCRVVRRRWWWWLCGLAEDWWRAESWEWNLSPTHRMYVVDACAQVVPQVICYFLPSHLQSECLFQQSRLIHLSKTSTYSCHHFDCHRQSRIKDFQTAYGSIFLNRCFKKKTKQWCHKVGQSSPHTQL